MSDPFFDIAGHQVVTESVDENYESKMSLIESEEITTDDKPSALRKTSG